MICNHCQKPIDTGKFITDFWGNRYHAAHLKTTPQCHYCGRFISKKLTGGGELLPDRKAICGICLKEAIVDRKQIVPIYNMIISFMNQKGLDLSRFKTDIFLMDINDGKDFRREEPGFINFKMSKAGGKILYINFSIYIIKGLPKTYFIETLAHELMHQWLILFGQDKMKPALTEGSCNYIAYLILKELKNPTSFLITDRMLKDKHPHYGKGFRKVLNYANNNGHKRVIDFLRSHRSI